MFSDRDIVQAVRAALSPARIGTYEAAVPPRSDADPSALVLYAWNSEISGALLAVLHMCEVVIRNAVSEVLETVYGHNWPWSTTFELSLPSPIAGYSPRRDLQAGRAQAPTTGKVIPELKMVFWQRLFTSRYDVRLWKPYFRRTFPHATTEETIAELRSKIYQDFEQLRRLRNRIAHHEPIFARDLTDDHAKIFRLLGYRCQLTEAWVRSHERAERLLLNRP